MRRNLYLTSSAAIALAMAFQGVPMHSAQAQDADSDFSIEEIIVTARKREENIQDTPLSIAAFTSDMIESANIKTLDDVAKFTAGFSFDEDFQRSNSFRPVIRGQSTILGASGVSTFIDGVLITGTILDYDLSDVERIEIIKGPQSALYGRNTYSGAISIITKSPTDEFSGQVRAEYGEFDQYDISASLRGPLSDTVAFSLTGRYYKRGGPFINTFDNTEVGQQESKSISGVLYLQPSEKMDVRVRARYATLNDDQPRLFTTDPEDNNCFTDIGGTFNGNGRYFCGEITERPIAIDDVRLLDEKGSNDSDDFQSSVTVNYDLSNGWDLTFIAGYNSTDIEEKGDFGYRVESFNPFTLNFGGAPFGPGPLTPVVGIVGPVADFAQDITVDRWDYSNELRLAFEGDGYDLMAGAYFFDSSSTTTSNRVAPSDTLNMIFGSYFGEITRMVDLCDAANGGAGACSAPVFNVFLGPNAFPDFAFAMNFIGLGGLELHANRDVVTRERRNIAAFAMMSSDISDKLTVSIEGRLTSERITSNTVEGVDIYDWTGTLTGSTRTQTPVREATFVNIDPRFTARYAVTDDSNIYAVAARGTKPGGFNNTEVIPLDLGSYDQENVWSFELGSKSVLMDGRFIFNVAAFYNTINGYQLTESVIIPALNETTTVITNKGKVRVKGLELELVFAPAALPGLVFNANYAYTDSSFLEGTDINEGKLNDVLDDMLLNCSIGLADAAAPCGDTGDNVLPGSIVGRQLPRQAKHMYNIGLNYTVPVSDSWSVVANGNMSYESKKFVQVHNLAWVGAATLFNASIGIETGNIRIIAWGKNLTDEDAVVSASRFADEGASFQRIFMGNPRIGRQFGATVSYKF